MGRAAETVVLKEPSGWGRNRVFIAASALLFIACTAGTIVWCGSMTGGMDMPGGWTMSMAWMRMPGQTWFGAAASFMGMWVVMMVAMMLPSLAPVLAGSRRHPCEPGDANWGGLTTIVAAAYFLLWTAVGAVAYPVGVLAAAAEMRWPALARNVPIATGLVLMLAGCFQLTAWKARHLGCCRATVGCGPAERRNLWGAFEQGIRLGVYCVSCCCGFMMILFAAGVMNLQAMGIIAVAITLERLAPWPAHTARAAGVLAIAIGAVWMAQGLGLPSILLMI